jgi:hypothetical protein
MLIGTKKRVNGSWCLTYLCVCVCVLQFPVLKIETNDGSGGCGSNGGSNGGSSLSGLPAPMQRTIVAFEKSILECHFLRDKSPAILRELEEILQALSRFHDQLDTMVDQAGLKGKQSCRVYDVHGWNLSLIINHVELLENCQRDCGLILDQVSTFLLLSSNAHFFKF